MVDPEAMRRRLALLRDALADLRRYRDRVDADALRRDRDAQHMVLHALYVAAQSTIDIALHACADAEQPTATTYQQAFAHLATSGRLDQAFARKLMGWAGLRNVLAHQYASIDLGRVAAALHGELDDLDRFAAIAAAWA
ncbi:MAG: type VII toxin-antitoxin system HepT family RNase toxin [Planctomycetota bacterium]